MKLKQLECHGHLLHSENREWRRAFRPCLFKILMYIPCNRTGFASTINGCCKPQTRNGGKKHLQMLVEHWSGIATESTQRDRFDNKPSFAPPHICNKRWQLVLSGKLNPESVPIFPRKLEVLNCGCGFIAGILIALPSLRSENDGRVLSKLYFTRRYFELCSTFKHVRLEQRRPVSFKFL